MKNDNLAAAGATRWMLTGDTRTGLPFLLNKVPTPKYVRVWVPMPHDEEVVAIDISFPSSGHNISKPLYMVLHGLNGGSSEGEKEYKFCKTQILLQIS
jgi:predicted alpha/beta-fold hydrolase